MNNVNNEYTRIRFSNVRLEKTKLGYTPLMIAAAEGHLDIVRLLLFHGGARDADPDLSQVQPWAENRAEVKFQGDLGFFAYSNQRQDPGNQTKVLDICPDAVTAAASRGHLQIVQLLVDAGALKDGVIETTLSLSKDWGMQETVCNLYPCPLYAAIAGGHVAVAQTLLAQGAKMNTSGKLIIKVPSALFGEATWGLDRTSTLNTYYAVVQSIIDTTQGAAPDVTKFVKLGTMSKPRNEIQQDSCVDDTHFNGTFEDQPENHFRMRSRQCICGNSANQQRQNLSAPQFAIYGGPLTMAILSGDDTMLKLLLNDMARLRTGMTNPNVSAGNKEAGNVELPKFSWETILPWRETDAEHVNLHVRNIDINWGEGEGAVLWTLNRCSRCSVRLLYGTLQLAAAAGNVSVLRRLQGTVGKSNKLANPEPQDGSTLDVTIGPSHEFLRYHKCTVSIRRNTPGQNTEPATSSEANQGVWFFKNPVQVAKAHGNEHLVTLLRSSGSDSEETGSGREVLEYFEEGSPAPDFIKAEESKGKGRQTDRGVGKNVGSIGRGVGSVAIRGIDDITTIEDLL